MTKVTQDVAIQSLRLELDEFDKRRTERSSTVSTLHTVREVPGSSTRGLKEHLDARHQGEAEGAGTIEQLGLNLNSMRDRLQKEEEKVRALQDKLLSQSVQVPQRMLAPQPCPKNQSRKRRRIEEDRGAVVEGYNCETHETFEPHSDIMGKAMEVFHRSKKKKGKSFPGSRSTACLQQRIGKYSSFYPARRGRHPQTAACKECTLAGMPCVQFMVKWYSRWMQHFAKAQKVMKRTTASGTKRWEPLTTFNGRCRLHQLIYGRV